jgi:hypothetical protein
MKFKAKFFLSGGILTDNLYDLERVGFIPTFVPLKPSENWNEL